MFISSSISDARLAANRANAKLSTGPNITEGRKASAVNSVTHGLSASPETLFAAHPEAQEAYQSHTQKLQKDCQPNSTRENDAFQHYAWATFQSKRARNLETLAQDRWLEDPDDPKRFSQMERIVKLASSQERRAHKAMNELRQLQRDRFVIGNDVPITRSLPIADIRNGELGQTNPPTSEKIMLPKTNNVKNEENNTRTSVKNENNRDKPNEANPLQYLLIGQTLKLGKYTGISK